jgi:predicted nucleic acid-binding Zn ribbon protein
VPGATIINHRHCAVCGKAILPSQTTCEGECVEKFARLEAGRRRYRMAWIGLTILIVIVYVLIVKGTAG